MWSGHAGGVGVGVGVDVLIRHISVSDQVPEPACFSETRRNGLLLLKIFSPGLEKLI